MAFFKFLFSYSDFSYQDKCLRKNFCNEMEYRCVKSGFCIELKHVCDGISHCPYADDENSCGKIKNIKNL